MQGDKESIDAILRRQYYMLHGWKLSGETDQLQAFFRTSTR